MITESHQTMSSSISHAFQCMGSIFCVEFQRYPLKFHTKYRIHTLTDVYFIQGCRLQSSQIWAPASVFETIPGPHWAWKPGYKCTWSTKHDIHSLRRLITIVHSILCTGIAVHLINYIPDLLWCPTCSTLNLISWTVLITFPKQGSD